MRSLAPSLLLLLGGCAVGDRQIETRHQPVVGANSAYVPGCPDWSTSLAQAHEGNSSNFGCATMTNLAAMIANPQDLLHGQDASTGSGDVAVKAIKAWREAAPTSKSWVVTTSTSTTGSGGSSSGGK